MVDGLQGGLPGTTAPTPEPERVPPETEILGREDHPLRTQDRILYLRKDFLVYLRGLQRPPCVFNWAFF